MIPHRAIERTSESANLDSVILSTQFRQSAESAKDPDRSFGPFPCGEIGKRRQMRCSQAPADFVKRLSQSIWGQLLPQDVQKRR
jgi:hypothetical protein